MRHFSLFLFFLSYSLGFAQTVNLYEPASGQIYPNQMYFCASETFNLKVDAAASSTGDYRYSSDSPGAFPLSAGGTDIIFPATGANKFSTSFPIGFAFSFYGKTYTKVVAGSNGRLVFTNDSALDNLNDVNTYTDRTFSGIAGYNTYAQLPSTDYNKVFKNNPTQELPLAQIFFGYTDLVPKSVNSSVSYTYKNVTVGGKNALQVSYQNQIRSNGRGGISSQPYNSNILLIEDGRIVIYINDKREVVDADGKAINAILGIQNDDASKFKVPRHSNNAFNYNNGQWLSEGVAWIFTPNQNLTPQFKWFRNGTLLSEIGDTLSGFAPNDNDVLKIEVSYLEEPTNIKTDQVTFKKIAKPIITPSSTGGCVTGVTLTVPSDPALKFDWFRVGNATALASGNSYYAGVSGDYFVRATRITAPLCFEESLPINVNLNSTIPAFNENNTPRYYCETTGAPTKTINLYNYYPADPTRYSLVFKENGTVIPNPGSFVINANTSRTVHIDVIDTNPASECTINENFIIRYDSLPAAINNLPKRFCFGETSVDVSQYLQDVAGANFLLFDYEYSTNGTTYSINSVINPTTFSKVWVRISPKNPPVGSCSTVSTILFTQEPKVIANTPTTQLPPQCSSSFTPFNLASLIPEINSGNVTVTFHNSPTGAQNGIDVFLNDNIEGTKTVYIRVKDNVTGCFSQSYPTITLVVYKKPNVIITTPIVKTNCAGNPVFDLTQNASTLTNAQSPITVILEYYAPNGTLLTGNQITNYDEALSGANPYIKVIYNTTCSDVVTFNLSYNPKPVAIITQIPICSETTYSLEDFKNKVVNNPSQYTFTGEDGNPLPANFNVSDLPKPIKFFLKDNTTGCISELQTVTFLQNGNSALDATETAYELCDTDFDGKTEFNLDSKKQTFTGNQDATFEYFKDAGFTPSQSIPAKYTNETPFAQTVYVRITLPGFCPSSAEIHLIANIPTKSSTLEEKYFICYGETLSIDAGSENDSIIWSDGQSGQTAEFTTAGTYSVTLKNGPDGCPYTHPFTISDENQPKITVINQTNNSIEVIAEGGVQPYWYYFNGVKQRSPILQNPTEASYEIQVQSETGCFGPPKTVYFIKINNAFTPNGDGINDVWFIDNLDKMEQVSIIIVDRYGTKVFESTKPSETRWDGKQQGRALSTSTYWYAVSWYDPVTQKNEQRQGWILLKNRN